MKRFFCTLIILSLNTALFAQKFKQAIVSTDIGNFWTAYDKIIATKDSATQYRLLKDLLS